MHRVVAVLAMLGLCLGLTGCQGGAAQPSSASSAAEGGEPTSGAGSISTPVSTSVSTPVSTSMSTLRESAPSTTTGPHRKKIVVVLDPGHNGGNAAAPGTINKLVPAGGFRKPCNTTGTSTDSGYPEHAFAWDVVQRAAELLRNEGITVITTRPDDAGVGPCVDERAHVANRAKAALAVSVHADGASPEVRGFHVIEPAAAPDGGNRQILKPSQKAARDLRAAFEKATGQPRATYPGSRVSPGLTSRDDLAGLNLARVPAVFIEAANMRNAKDAARVRSAEWRQKAAQGIADGVLAFVRGSG